MEKYAPKTKSSALFAGGDSPLALLAENFMVTCQVVTCVAESAGAIDSVSNAVEGTILIHAQKSEFDR
jgi:hypothetical protein